VELEVKFKVQWRWSGVEVKTSGGGVEVEEEILNLGTLVEILIKVIFWELKHLLSNEP
jgi:hypothetical protein